MSLTPEQIAYRRTGIYGTDAKRIVDGDWRALWREKKGLAEPEDLSGILRVQLGSATEQFNLDWYEKQTGRQVTNRRERRVAGFRGAHLDGLTTTSRGYPAYIDAKHVGRADEATVIRYTPQMTHVAGLVCGVDWWCLSFLIGNSRWELIEQEVDPMFADELLLLEKQFWHFVEIEEEPPENIGYVSRPPKPTPTFRSIDLNGDLQPGWPNWAPPMIEEFSVFARTKAAADANAIARESIKKLLPEDVGMVMRGNIFVQRKKDMAVTITLRREGKDG